MNIRLDCGSWIVNEEYIIIDDNENGYCVCKYGCEEDSLYESTDFESCLIWCWNS